MQPVNSPIGRTVGHRPELDGIRGIAILVVLASHAHVPGFAENGGVAGVTLFFVLSGYLITSILAAEIAAKGRVNLPRFYLRRGLRLLPALVAVIVAASLGYAVGVWPVYSQYPLTVVSVLAYMGNWAGIGGLNLGVLAHAWSLAIEEQFYLFWPLLLVIGLRYRRFALALILVALAVTPYRFLIGDNAHAFAGADSHVDALFIGCVIALLRVRLPSVLGWAGIAAIMILGLAWDDLLVDLPLATIASGLAVAGVPMILDSRPLAYLGRISYGLYLWHYLLVWSGLPWPVVICASLVVAALSYRYLETPFLRLKDLDRRQVRQPDVRLGAAEARVVQLPAVGAVDHGQ